MKLFGLLLLFVLSGCASTSVTEYNRGYDRGASDTAKRQYWILQEQQKASDSSQPQVRYYSFPVANSKEGVNEVPHEVVVPVVR